MFSISRAGSGRNVYLVFPARTFLLLLYEVRSGRRRRRRPHAANDSDTVLWQRGESELLALPNLYALELLKATEGELKWNTGFKYAQMLLICRVVTNRCGRRTRSLSPGCSSTTATTPSSSGNGGRGRCRIW